LKRVQYSRKTQVKNIIEGQHIYLHGKNDIKYGVLASSMNW